MEIKRIEDIYPCTIVHMRHGKFAIVEGCAEYPSVQDLQEDEEVQYHPHHYMREEWEHMNYGIGDTINEAFENYKKCLK